jgi:competence protein ComGC
VAGWYPDPSDPLLLRHWDGAAWTATTAPKGSVAYLTSDEDARRKHTNLVAILSIVGASFIIMVIGFILMVLVPISRAQEAKLADTQAKSDVATLGRDIALYHVDHAGPPPQISVVDGEYHLVGAYPPYNVEIMGPGVEFGGVTGTGPTDWCVWVTNPDGEYKDFEYSAVDGLQQGCF